MKKNVWTWALIPGMALGLAACGVNDDNGNTMQQEMQQEQPEEAMDEREDEQLNAPGVEYQQERQENRMDEAEDDR